MTTVRSLFLGCLFVSALSCSGGSSGDAPGAKNCVDGSETCACYGNGTCDSGLECRSNLCVSATTATSAGGSTGVGGSTAAAGVASNAGTMATGGTTATGGTAAGGTATGGTATGGTATGGTATGGATTGTGGGACSGGVCVDTIGSAARHLSATSENSPCLNVYLMSEARSLTMIEQSVGADHDTTLTWVVYESTSLTGTFTQIWSSTTLLTTLGASFKSSGTLSPPVSLVAGRYYAIGVGWGAVPIGTFSYSFVPTTTFPFSTSFGQVITTYYNLTAQSDAPATLVITTTDPSSVFEQRLTSSK